MDKNEFEHMQPFGVAVGISEKEIEYHKNCHDCGQFLKKDRWVSKTDEKKTHGLCAECFSNYDDPRDY